MKDYSTPAEGILKREADGTIASQEVTEVELVDLAAVATSGSYNDLKDKPTIPTIDVSSLQPKITVNGFLKGDGSGNITADKPVYVVTTTSSGSKLISDKTAKQIYDAYSAGCQVVVSFSGLIIPMTVCLRDGEGTTDSPYSYTIMFDGPNSQQNVNQSDRGYFNNVIYAYGLTDSGDSFNAIDATSVPTTRTINNKALSANITLNAADVEALPTSGGTMNGSIKFATNDDPHYGILGILNNTLLIGQSIKHGIQIDNVTKKISIIASGNIVLRGPVNFTNATVTGLKGLLPTVTASDNGQFLRVVNGAWAAATVDNANGVSF